MHGPTTIARDSLLTQEDIIKANEILSKTFPTQDETAWLVALGNRCRIQYTVLETPRVERRRIRRG